MQEYQLPTTPPGCPPGECGHDGIGTGSSLRVAPGYPSER